MLAKMTSNRLTLPRSVRDQLGDVPEYFDVALCDGQIVLTPVRIQRGDAVRAKLAGLGLGPSDVADAVDWARNAKPSPVAAEAGPAHRNSASRRKPRA